jgi:serine/threonine protein kinase
MAFTIIGKGTYGIVFKPIIPCNKIIENTSNMVSKVFLNKKDAIIEWKNSIIIRKLLNYEKYFLISLYHSQISKNILKQILPPEYHEKYINNLNPNQVSFHQHYIYYGGMSIYKYFITNYKNKQTSYSTIIYLIHNIFYAIQFLIKNKYVHQDISINNILIHRFDSKLIDMGFNFIHFDNFYNLPSLKIQKYDNSLFHIDYKYYLNPPEYLLIHNCHLLKNIQSNPNDVVSFNLIINAILANMNVILNCYRLNKLYNIYINEILWYSEFKFFINDIIKSIPDINNITLMEYFKNIKIHLKSDIYSIGISMLSFDNYINKKKTMSIRDIKIQKYYNRLLLGIIHPSPIHRFDISNAVYYIQKIKNIY